MSSYEQQRLSNIQSNLAKLEALGVATLKPVVAPKPKKPSPKRRRTESDAAPVTRRTSLRNMGLAPDGETAVHRELQQRYTDELAALVARDQRKNGDVAFSDCTVGTPAPSVAALVAAFASLSSTAESDSPSASASKGKPKRQARGAKSVEAASSAPADGSISKAWREKTVFQKLSAECEASKLCKKRVSSAVFHPLSTEQRSIVVLADTIGTLGFQVLGARGESSDERDDAVSVFSPHTQPVYSMSFSPSDPHRLITASHDGSVRAMDVEKQSFLEVYAPFSVASPETVKLTSFTFARNVAPGSTIYLCDDDGDMRIVDTRVSPSKLLSKHTLHSKKIGCIDWCRTNEFLFTTSSNDRAMSIWDCRKIKDENSSLASVEHGATVTSAYFSPAEIGGAPVVLTTSVDDTVRLTRYDGTSDVHVRTLKHNNHTGRWITNFRAQWAPTAEFFVVGNMERRVDVFSVTAVDGGAAAAAGGAPSALLSRSLQDEHLTAIPAVNVFAPANQVRMVSATASGYALIWSL